MIIYVPALINLVISLRLLPRWRNPFAFRQGIFQAVEVHGVMNGPFAAGGRAPQTQNQASMSCSGRRRTRQSLSME
jgi:hypothetical protein